MSRQVQIIVPHDQQAVVEIDSAVARLLTTTTPPGFGFDIQTWEKIEPGPYPSGPFPAVHIYYKAR